MLSLLRNLFRATLLFCALGAMAFTNVKMRFDVSYVQLAAQNQL